MAYRDHSRKKVSYFYDNCIGDFHFGKKHVMKPYRVKITNDMIIDYGLYKKMYVYRPEHATSQEMMLFHSEEYISFLQSINHNSIDELKDSMRKFYVGTSENDCPIFEGLYQFAQMYCGASLAAAINLNKKMSDICINWSGGLHHALKSSASGFCYVNDIVLAILELLKFHQRVLYIDIDVHHGDGVEEAFYTTDRVMTVSFHQYDGKFFPGTGYLDDIGAGKGKYYALNAPLKKGMDDLSYEMVFLPIMAKVMEMFQPSAVVLQCGADSLTGDRLGEFNLTLKGHGKCVEYIRSFNIPMLLLGGGGYTVKNVSRCWTYETSIALNVDLPDDLPLSLNQIQYFLPDKKLHIHSNEKMKNKNSKQDLCDVVVAAIENLRNVSSAPSVHFQDIPSYAEENKEDETMTDLRQTQLEMDRQILPDNEFYD